MYKRTGRAKVLRRDLRVSGLQGHVEILARASRWLVRLATAREVDSSSLNLVRSSSRLNLSTIAEYR